MKLIHGKKFTEADLRTFRQGILSNLTLIFVTIVQEMRKNARQFQSSEAEVNKVDHSGTGD
jgi:hypothetical protein